MAAYDDDDAVELPDVGPLIDLSGLSELDEVVGRKDAIMQAVGDRVAARADLKAELHSGDNHPPKFVRDQKAEIDLLSQELFALNVTLGKLAAMRKKITATFQHGRDPARGTCDGKPDVHRMACHFVAVVEQAMPQAKVRAFWDLAREHFEAGDKIESRLLAEASE